MTNPTPSATPPDDIERQLEHLFEGLGPHIEAHRELDRQLNERLAHRFNPLFYLRTDERALSWLIAGLLDPSAAHGQGALFLNLLLDLDGLKLSKWTGGLPARVRTEGPAHIDISVELIDHFGSVRCLAFENKPYARDQRKQIERYAEHLSKRYDDFRLIYLTPRGTPPSEWSVDKDSRAALAEQLLQMGYVEAPSSEDPPKQTNHSVDVSLCQWLEECRTQCDVERLQSFLAEVQSFFKQQFGGERVTTESDAIRDFLRSNPDHLEAALLVKSCGFEETIRKEFMELIGNTVIAELDDRLLSSMRGTDDWKCVGQGGHHWKTNVYIFRPGSWSDGRSIGLQATGRGVHVGVSWGRQRSKMTDAEGRRFDEMHGRLKERLKQELELNGRWTEWWPWAADVDVVPEIPSNLRYLVECCDVRNRSDLDRTHPGRMFMESAVKTVLGVAENAIPVINELEKESR